MPRVVRKNHELPEKDGLKETGCESGMGRIEKLVEFLHDLKRDEFTGFLRINYSQGGITKIEKTEEILRKIQAQSK